MYVHMYICIYMYIFMYLGIWVSYNHLTATSLEPWLIREIISKWPWFRLVKYSHSPIICVYIYMWYIYICVYTYMTCTHIYIFIYIKTKFSTVCENEHMDLLDFPLAPRALHCDESHCRFWCAFLTLLEACVARPLQCSLDALCNMFQHLSQ